MAFSVKSSKTLDLELIYAFMSLHQAANLTHFFSDLFFLPCRLRRFKLGFDFTHRELNHELSLIFGEHPCCLGMKEDTSQCETQGNRGGKTEERSQRQMVPLLIPVCGHECTWWFLKTLWRLRIATERSLHLQTPVVCGLCCTARVASPLAFRHLYHPALSLIVMLAH